MNPEIRKDIVDTLTTHHKGVVAGNYINRIECPSCHKREAFTAVDKPWVVKCGRENKCGEANHVKDLFPELFESWTERYQPKTEAARQANPTAVADAYLRDGRGFDLLRVRGWYTQEHFYSHELGIGSTTVRFKLPRGHWERLLDKPSRFGKQKANLVGKYKGEVWQPPMFTNAELADAKEVWIVEGIFDAIALLHVGIVAVSNISSSNYPDTWLAQLAESCSKLKKKRPTLVWAQDSDRAGRKSVRKFRKLAEQEGWNCGAAQPPGEKNYDWNDLLQLERLGENDLIKYRYYGDLLLANSAVEKALLMYHQRERREFWFTHDAQIWWWKLDMDAYDRELRARDSDGNDLTPAERQSILKSAGVVTCICSALPKPLYYQANHVTDESWYYFSVELPDGRVLRKPFTAKQLTSSSEFKNRLLAIAQNAWYTGTGKQLDRLMQEQMRSIKTVETIDYIGYSKEHSTYIFDSLAVKDGKATTVNDMDYFQFGKLSVKSLSNAPLLAINTNQSEHNPAWTTHLVAGFGVVGVVTLAFWLGSLFCEQIRSKHSSYPYFELVGEAGAGKTTLIEFLWKLCGRDDWEGLDPQKMTTAALNRYFTQVSNLPVVLIEADREQDKAKQKQFSWDDLKPAYNGRPMRSRGVKNNGNDTYEPPFRGAFVISQNANVEASEAILSRITHITLTREHHTPQSKVSSDWLARVPVEEVSGFLVTALNNEKALIDLFELQAKHYEDYLQSLDGVRMYRIAKNHGQLLALVECLGPMGLKLFPEEVITEARGFVTQMAQQRQNAINTDHPYVVEFWEAYDYIEGTGDKPKLNHYGPDSQLIAVNLKEFERWCGEFKLRTPEMRLIKPYLRSSKSRPFVDANKAVRSQVHDNHKTMKCWVFENR